MNTETHALVAFLRAAVERLRDRPADHVVQLNIPLAVIRGAVADLGDLCGSDPAGAGVFVQFDHEQPDGRTDAVDTRRRRQ